MSGCAASRPSPATRSPGCSRPGFTSRSTPMTPPTSAATSPTTTWRWPKGLTWATTPSPPSPRTPSPPAWTARYPAGLAGQETGHVRGVGVKGRHGLGAELGERGEDDLSASDRPGRHGPAAGQRERPEQPVVRDDVPVRADDGIP